MKARPMATLALAAVLAAAAVALAHTWLQARAPVAGESLRRAGVETVPVVVAAQALGFGERLAPAHLRVVSWPKDTVPVGAFGSLEAVLPAADPRPRAVLRAIEAGEPVLASKLSGPGGSASLSAMIATGMRAVTIPVSGPGGVAGFVVPGDRVDVLLTRGVVRGVGSGIGPFSDILLQDMKVLGVDQSTGAGEACGGLARTVTLEASARAAQKLALAQTQGTLSLALRRPDGADPARNRTLTLRDLGTLPLGLPKPAPLGAGVLQAGGEALAVGAGAVVDAIGARDRSGLAAVRVVRGLEETNYEVVSEDAPTRLGARRAP